jgi:SAM-dependent methyltransferase
MTSLATQRFDKLASNFATSEVHSSSQSIRRLHEFLELPPEPSVIDIACGAGHLALSFGDRAKRIVGVDGAPAMLAAFQKLAKERAIQVETVLAMSDSVSLSSGEFDVAVSRLAPHHFPNLQASVQEMARLVRPGGYVAIVDLHGYDDPGLDEFNHRLEILHDPTHVRSHRPSVWRNTLAGAGLEVLAFETHLRESANGISIQRWCEIAASGLEAEQAIRAQLASASAATLNALGIVPVVDQVEFVIPVRTLLAVARKTHVNN